MTVGSILLGVALLLVVGLFLARPFLFPAARQAEEARLSQREELVAQKEAVLVQIRELDFDRETGKLPDEEYQTLRQQYLAEAAQLLKALEALQPAGDKVTATDEIEAAIARMRERPLPAEDDIEAAVARRRQQAATNGQTGAAPAATATAADQAPAKRAAFCPQCGEAREGEDKFCAYCGHAFA